MPQPYRDPQQPQPLRRRSTNIVRLIGVRDDETDTFPTNATVTCTLRTLAGVAVPGATDLTMTYVDGTLRYETAYRCMILAAVDLPDVQYIARIRFVLAGAEREFNIPCPVIDG